MSVRSKALCFAILVAAVASMAACSVGGSSSTPADSPLADSQQSMQGEGQEAVYGDSAAQASASDLDIAPEITTAEVGTTPGLPAAEMVAAESRELLQPTGGIAIRQESGNGFTRLLIDVEGGEPAVDVMTLSNPSRLVVDLLGTQGRLNRELAVGDSFVETVRIGGHKDRTRVVFDLGHQLETSATAEHQVETQDGQVVVTFQDPAVQVAAAPAPAAPVAATLPAPVTEEEELAAAEVEEEGQELAAAEPMEDALEESTEVAELEDDTTEIAANSDESILLDAVTFEKSTRDSGRVVINLSDKAAFHLQRTAPSEYVLTVPGATAASRTTIPQIAPRGFPGIRSARAVQRDDAALVRMFVDPTVELMAVPRGNEVLIEARALADNPGARAQLEVGDEPKGEAAPAAEEPASGDLVARENPTGIRAADGSKVYTGRLISLDLQDTDIDNALRIIAEVSNLNIIASDDVSGKVTLRLIDVPWDQALDVILKTNGLDQVTEGNVIRIAPVDKLRQEREALREAKRAAENLEDLTVQYIRVSYARVGDMVDQVQSVLSERGTVTEDERTNQLIVKDIRKGHEQALELIRRLDLRTPQVLLETQIVEGQRSIMRDLGFQWNFNYSQSPQTGNATGLNFPNSVVLGGSGTPTGEAGNAVNFPAALESAAGSAVSAVFDSADGARSLAFRLSALESEGKVRVISRPQVATVNNKTAEIKSVETVRVRLPDSGTSVATGAGATATGGGRTAFEEIDVGIELTVTPQASPDYYVLMDVQTKSSTFGNVQVDNIPSTLDRQATSTILVKSGQTFALGGVYRIEDSDEVQGVPFLKDIPFVGHVFRRTGIDKSDEELIFFITPHIVEGSFDPALM